VYQFWLRGQLTYASPATITAIPTAAAVKTSQMLRLRRLWNLPASGSGELMNNPSIAGASPREAQEHGTDGSG
jgi:hypothetical protein